MGDRFEHMSHDVLLAEARLLDDELATAWASHQRLFDALALSRTCTYCGAAPGQRCQTRRGGRATYRHMNRLEYAHFVAWNTEEES